MADMVGNVWEWIGHPYVADYDSEKHLMLQEVSDFRALRGGSWMSDPGQARCSSRGKNDPDHWNHLVGFRVVLSLAN